MAKKKAAKNPHSDTPEATPMLDSDFNPVKLGETKLDLPELSPDEVGYQVQGYYASVRFTRGVGASPSMFAVTCCAFARDKEGKPYLTSLGLPIEGAHTASCPKKDLLGNKGKVNEVRQMALTGALREMMAHIAENVAFENLQI